MRLSQGPSQSRQAQRGGSCSAHGKLTSPECEVSPFCRFSPQTLRNYRVWRLRGLRHSGHLSSAANGPKSLTLLGLILRQKTMGKIMEMLSDTVCQGHYRRNEAGQGMGEPGGLP